MALHNQVFAQQIWEWLCNDMDSCFKVSQEIQTLRDRSRFKGGLNFPAALAMFSIIDLVAGYYSGKEPTTDHIGEFVSKYLGKYSPKLRAKGTAKKWYEVFRNGLMHQWSPKAGAVAMDFRQWDVFEFWAPNGTEEIPYLMVPRLFEVLKNALHDYESDLNSDVALQSKFEARYSRLLSCDRKEMEAFKKLCSDTAHPPKVSGTSGPAHQTGQIRGEG